MNCQGENLQETARLLCKNQQWRELLKFSNDWNKNSHTDYLAKFYQGVAFQSLNLTDLAIDSYNHAIALNPDDPRIWSNLALAYDQKGLINEAEQFLEQAFKIDPCDRIRGLDLANFFGRTKKYKEAESLFKQLIEKFPSDEEITRGLMLSLLAQSKYSELCDILGDIDSIFPELTKEFSPSDDKYSLFSKWKSEVSLSFVKLFCSKCQKSFQRNYPDWINSEVIHFYHIVDGINVKVFTKWAWCFNCQKVQKGFFAAQPLDKNKIERKIVQTHQQIKKLPDKVKKNRSSQITQALFGSKLIPNLDKYQLNKKAKYLEWILRLGLFCSEFTHGLNGVTVCMCCLGKKTQPIIEEHNSKTVRKTNCSCDVCGDRLNAVYSYTPLYPGYHINPAFPTKEHYKLLDTKGRVIHKSEIVRNDRNVLISGINLDFFTMDNYSSIQDINEFTKWDIKTFYV